MAFTTSRLRILKIIRENKMFICERKSSVDENEFAAGKLPRKVLEGAVTL